LLTIGGVEVGTRAPRGRRWLACCRGADDAISALLMVWCQRWTPASRPGAATLARYF
jgi:hypothetical protein